MRVIVQIWDAENQEATRRVGVTSPRIASKIAETLHDGKAAKIVPKADIKAPRSDVHPISRAGVSAALAVRWRRTSIISPLG